MTIGGKYIPNEIQVKDIVELTVRKINWKATIRSELWLRKIQQRQI